MFNSGDEVKLKHVSGPDLEEDARRSGMPMHHMVYMIGHKLVIVGHNYRDNMDRHMVTDTETGITWYLWAGCLVSFNRCVFDV